MSWLSKRVGIDINLKKVVPTAFYSALEQKAFTKALKQLDDASLRSLSIALDNEWMDRKRNAGYDQ